MKRLDEILALLSTDEVQLRLFLEDPDRWVASLGAGKAEADELSRIAVDCARYLEWACRTRLERSGEHRFCQGRAIARRRFMFGATSAALSLPLASLLAADTTRSEVSTGARGRENLVAATDDGCSNTLTCNDVEFCEDHNCMNSGLGGCKDESGCKDNGCENSITCKDETQCKDTSCINKGTCLDSSCTDATQCENQGAGGCVDQTCTDATTCSNLHLCRDTNICQDDPSCSNAESCKDTLCRDVGCTNSADCEDVTKCQ